MPEIKYDLIKVGRMQIHRSDDFRKFYQIQATRDIPEHGVKAGDLGGYVTHKDALDQMGSCWIGEQAQVIGKNVIIVNDVYIGGKAVVRSEKFALCDHIEIIISKSAKVTGNATVFTKPSFAFSPKACHITDEVHIYGEAILDNVKYVTGVSKIYGDAEIDCAESIRDSEIYGRALIEKLAIVNQSSIYGDAMISEGAIVDSSAIYGSACISKGHIAPGTVIEGDKTLFKNYLPVVETPAAEIFSVESLSLKAITPALENKAGSRETSVIEDKQESSAVMKAYREVCASIESYRNDVVKLIKYPVMTDQTDDHTLEMMVALKTVQRLEDDTSTAEFKDAVAVLEKTFMKAESNARKIASTLLSDADRKKTEKAKDLFRVASNEASSEREKKNAFVQGFKQLEGVLDVPDVAIDAFRIRIGLPELEM